ncbi:MAG: DUF3048 domain-containing protein [Anaerovoracaceae bacterium]
MKAIDQGFTNRKKTNKIGRKGKKERCVFMGRQKRRGPKGKGNTKTVVIIVAILIVLIAGAMFFIASGKENSKVAPEKQALINPLTGLEVKSLPARPFILSTDNDSSAARPQSGLSKADIVYEFPVEGGGSRLEPIYYSKLPGKIGPARSARPYFIDMAREYKAVFVHHGWSPAAEKYLKSGVIPHISAFEYNDIFYRSTDRSSPHNSYINGKDIQALIKKKGWDEKQKPRSFEFLGKGGTPNGNQVKEVKVNYIAAKNTYVYDDETGLYGRSVNGAIYTDKETENQITTSNIVVQKVQSKVLDQKGRLKIDMTTGGKCWLFTQGKVMGGTWSKADLDSPTIYKDSNDVEFKLTPGNTWIQVIDGSSSVNYKEIKPETEITSESGSNGGE